MLRWWLIVLLSLTIPLQGWAGAQLPPTHCSMPMHVAAEQSASGTAESALTGDCCNDLQTFAKTGQSCKSAQECPAPLLGLLPVPHGLSHALPPFRAPSALEPPTTLGMPAAVWRSPTRL